MYFQIFVAKANLQIREFNNSFLISKLRGYSKEQPQGMVLISTNTQVYIDGFENNDSFTLKTVYMGLNIILKKLVWL